VHTAFWLVGRPEGRRPLGRPRRRWKDKIKMDLGEIGFGDVDWIHWAERTLSFLRRTLLHGVS
jgi:hypothetical protein